MRSGGKKGGPRAGIDGRRRAGRSAEGEREPLAVNEQLGARHLLASVQMARIQ